MKAGKLEGRRKTFAEKVAEGHTATKAYLLAGYRPLKRETAHRAASRLYTNPAVRTYIRELRRTGDELDREETTLTIAKKLAFLARLVLTSSATLREDDPLIQSHRILKDGSTSIRIPCKLKALKMHSELAGHFLPEPTEPPPPVDTLQLLFDQIRQSTGLEAQRADTGLEPQRGETRVQASEAEPHAHSFSARKILASGHSNTPSPQQTSTDHVAVPRPRDETWTQASEAEPHAHSFSARKILAFGHSNTPSPHEHPFATTGLEPQRGETRTQASEAEPHAHSFSARKILASGHSHTPSPQQTSTDHVAVPRPRDETWNQASEAEPHAHSFSARKILAFGHSNTPSSHDHPFATTGLEAQRAETRPQANPESKDPPQNATSFQNAHSLPKPEGRASLSEGAHLSENALPQTTPATRANANQIASPEPAPSAMKHDSEQSLHYSATRKEAPNPLSPLTLARKAIITQLQQSSPISHLYVPCRNPKNG